MVWKYRYNYKKDITNFQTFSFMFSSWVFLSKLQTEFESVSLDTLMELLLLQLVGFLPKLKFVEELISRSLRPQETLSGNSFRPYLWVLTTYVSKIIIIVEIYLFVILINNDTYIYESYTFSNFLSK